MNLNKLKVSNDPCEIVISGADSVMRANLESFLGS
jgi:hypothetical protein